MNRSQSGCQVMLKLQEKESFDFLEEIRSRACWLMRFPIPQGPEGVGCTKEIEEIGRTGSGWPQNYDGIFNGSEGVAFQSL